MSAILYLFMISLCKSADPEDRTRNFTEICEARGYKTETHKVVTRDFYVLTLHRIVALKENSAVVFGISGLLTLSDIWVINDPSPGFLLAEAGFDVWFGNVRGTYYSREHLYLNPDSDPAYWDFTWNQMADFDLPDSLDFILEYTQQPTLTYIGHSQGSLILFAHLAQNPEFIQKINVFVAFAPIIAYQNITNPLFDLTDGSNPFDSFKKSGVYEFRPFKPTESQENLCENESDCEFQKNFFELLAQEGDNPELIPVYYPHAFGGTSVLNAEFWNYQMPMYKERKLQRFDYGEEKNFHIYGQASPPVFDLKKIPGPIALFYGQNDLIATVDNVQWIIQTLTQGTVTDVHFYENFAHTTWFLASDMNYFKDDVLPLIFKYSDLTQEQFLNFI